MRWRTKHKMKRLDRLLLHLSYTHKIVRQLLLHHKSEDYLSYPQKMNRLPLLYPRDGQPILSNSFKIKRQSLLCHQIGQTTSRSGHKVLKFSVDKKASRCFSCKQSLTPTPRLGGFLLLPKLEQLKPSLSSRDEQESKEIFLFILFISHSNDCNYFSCECNCDLRIKLPSFRISIYRYHENFYRQAFEMSSISIYSFPHSLTHC